MIKKRYTVKAVDCVEFTVVDLEFKREVGFGGVFLMHDLCAKLNRLAALEKVCGEIVEICGGEDITYLLDFCNERYYLDVVLSGDVQIKLCIEEVQKLKAVLEER